MDIYEMAKEVNADYYDIRTGYTYHIQSYNNAIKNGLPTKGIPITDEYGRLIGYAQRRSEI